MLQTFYNLLQQGQTGEYLDLVCSSIYSEGWPKMLSFNWVWHSYSICRSLCCDKDTYADLITTLFLQPFLSIFHCSAHVYWGISFLHPRRQRTLLISSQQKHEVARSYTHTSIPEPHLFHKNRTESYCFIKIWFTLSLVHC